MGELICSLKPQFCDENRTNRSCSMDKGEVVDGERHFDGCNQCLCRNGKSSLFQSLDSGKRRIGSTQKENIARVLTDAGGLSPQSLSVFPARSRAGF